MTATVQSARKCECVCLYVSALLWFRVCPPTHSWSPTTAVRTFVPLGLTKPDDIVILSKFCPQRIFFSLLFVLLFIILVLYIHNIYFILLSIRVQSIFFFHRYCFVTQISPLWNHTCYLILNFRMVHPVVYQQTRLIVHSCFIFNTYSSFTHIYHLMNFVSQRMHFPWTVYY